MFNEVSYNLVGLGELGDSCTQYEPLIYAAADRYGIDRAIARAQIKQESGCNPRVCSGAGACGIAQFIPATAARFGLTDRTNVAASLDAWGRYMRQLLDQFGGRYDLALAGYNSGENRASLRAGNIPNIPETKNYVASILGALGIGGGAAAVGSNPLAVGDSGDIGTILGGGIPMIAVAGAALVAAYFLLS